MTALPGKSLVVLLAGLLVLGAALAAAPRAALADDDPIQRTWNRSDWPVAAQQVTRTWMWGPPLTGRIEETALDAPGGLRSVQYFDKSRMEIATDPAVDPHSLWYVTNGLLAKELVTGQLQIGPNDFEPRRPAEVNVAGDPDVEIGPTYAAFTQLLDDPPIPDGALVTRIVHRNGSVSDDPALGAYGVSAAHHVQVWSIDHTVASVFWEFMQSVGTVYEGKGYVDAPLFPDPFYATGLPISEAYWTTVQIAGAPQMVLVQVFERRVLTYAPANPEGWQVEAGNVGRHYYQWRYGVLPSEPAPAIPPPSEPPAQPEPPPPPPRPSPFMDGLLAELQGMVAGWDGANAVSVTDLQTGRTVSVNGDRPQLAACTMKIFLMMAVAQDISAGRYQHDDIADLVHSAMGPSDTPPARELIRMIGQGSIASGIARINAIMQGLGMSRSIVTHPPGYPGADYGFGYGSNLLTTDDLNLAFGKLYQRQAGLSESETQYVLWSLTLATPGQRYSLGGGIPDEATLYHKIGLLYDPWSTWNDAGIVVFQRDGRDYAYAISYLGEEMGRHAEDWKKAYYRGADVSAAAWRAFSTAYP